MIVPVDKLNGQRLFVEIHLHIRHVSRSNSYIEHCTYMQRSIYRIILQSARAKKFFNFSLKKTIVLATSELFPSDDRRQQVQMNDWQVRKCNKYLSKCCVKNHLYFVVLFIFCNIRQNFVIR